MENFLACRKKAKQKKQTFEKKVQSFITNFFSTNKVKREKKGKDDGDLDILSSKQYNYTPSRKVRAMDEPDIEIIEVVAVPVFKPNQPPVMQKCREMASTSTAVGKTASAACSVNPEKDVTSDTMKSEQVMVHAEGKVKLNLQCELPSERVVEERNELQKQVRQLSQEMAEMKEVISWKRSLQGLMYMKSKILRKSKKSLKIEPKKKSVKSTRRKTSKDAASGSKDGAKKMDKESEMSSVETGENEAGKNTGTGSESGVKKMDKEVEMSSVETGENEPRKEVASGSKDGTKKMNVDFAMSPLSNAEIEDSKDDGTSIKKNEVYPTSNLGVGGEFHVAPENMESKGTSSYEDGVIKAMEKRVNH